MQTNEAIDVLREHEGKWLMAIEMAIYALERNVPKKPVESKKFPNLYVGLCPNCMDGSNSQFNYCCKCGQRLDWGESNQDV